VRGPALSARAIWTAIKATSLMTVVGACDCVHVAKGVGAGFLGAVYSEAHDVSSRCAVQAGANMKQVKHLTCAKK
jgi:hypothetical protein